MSIFKFSKKKEQEKKAPECACSCGCPSTGEQLITEKCCAAGDISSVKVLGSGCKSCHELYENAKQAACNLGVSSEVEYITDMQQVMGYGVMSMPALVVNEKVVSFGRVLKTAEIEKLIGKSES